MMGRQKSDQGQLFVGLSIAGQGTRSPIIGPSLFLECRLDAPPADPRKGPIGRTLGTVGDVLAPGIRSDRID